MSFMRGSVAPLDDLATVGGSPARGTSATPSRVDAEATPAAAHQRMEVHRRRTR